MSSSLTCTICSTPAKPRRAAEGLRVCGACVDRVGDAVAEVRDQYIGLTKLSALLPQTGEDGRRGPGFGSRSPARDIVLSVTDWRTRWDEDARLHNPRALLARWATRVRAEVDEQPPAEATIRTEADLLLRRLEHACRAPWITDMWSELRECRNQLRTIAGEPSPVSIGRCPVVPDGQDEECGTPLFAPLHGDTITCRGCGEQWPRSRWQILGKTIGVVV